MALTDDTEAMLRAYLEDQRKADLGTAVKHLADWGTRHDADDKVRHTELLGEIRGLSLRVGALERNDDKIEDRLERSGSWDREALQAQALTARDDANWWKRNWLSMVATVVAIVGAIAAFTKK